MAASTISTGPSTSPVFDHDKRENLETLRARGRLDPEALTLLNEQAKSVALLVTEEALLKGDDTSWHLNMCGGKTSTLQEIWGKRKPELIRDEDFCGYSGKFGTEPVTVLGVGTGFLITGKYLLTAASVICSEFATDDNPELNFELLKKLRVVFDYCINSEAKPQTIFTSVFRVKKIPFAWDLNRSQGIDYAILKLKCPIKKSGAGKSQTIAEINPADPTVKDISAKDRPPLWFQQEIDKTQEVYMAGYPSMLPLKFTLGGLHQESGDFSFKTDLHSFGGNVGSPVFDAGTKKVIGIDIEGFEVDYEFDYFTRSWRVYKQVPEKKMTSRHMKISYIMELIMYLQHKNLSKDAKRELLGNLSCRYVDGSLVTPRKYFLGMDITEDLKVLKVGFDKSKDCSRSYSESCVIS